jgi:glycerol uptake facilitator-like aquaporin
MQAGTSTQLVSEAVVIGACVAIFMHDAVPSVAVHTCHAGDAAVDGAHLLCCAAVTLAFLITKKVTLLRAFAYWFCQLTGAILGSSFVYAVRALF